ncbi:MAG: tetratricopeptide repeat protein [Anaerolineaceae bacterium]|nr:tetratricopeptide repeat protein [Anaerolineaceae bacterium]
MQFWDYLKSFIGLNTAPAPSPAVQNLQNAVEAGQRAKHAEHYAEAVNAFDIAADLAQDIGDYTGLLVIALHKAESLMGLGEWETAEHILQQACQAAKERGRETQMAYLMTGLGRIHQEQGDWTQARRQYEEALALARMVHAYGAEGRSLGHLADTYLHESNASYAAHLLREALTRLNTAGDTEMSSLFVGRLGQAMIVNGQENEGDQLLVRALRLAKQLGYRKYERHWGIVLGERANDTGRYLDAYRLLREALTLFPQDSVEPATIQALVITARTGLKVGASAEAADYARMVVTAAESQDDPHLQALARGVLGMALQANKQSAEAVPYLEEAIRAWDNPTKNALAEQIEILRTLAAAYAETDDHAAAETYQRAIQAASSRGMGLAEAQARRDLGLFYMERHQYLDAINEWSTALILYERENQVAQVARLHCDIAHARKRLGQGGRALKDYEQALITLNMLNADLETRGLVLSNAANAYVEQGDIESAEAFFNETLAIARRLNDAEAEVTRRGNYGWFLLVTGRSQQAISILEYALRKSESLNLTLQAAIQASNLGVAYDSVGQHEKALALHHQALAQIQPLDNAYWTHIFNLNLGRTLLALGEVRAAAALFAEAIQHGREENDLDLLIQGLTGDAQAAMREKHYLQAEAQLTEAISLARRADSRRLLAEALSTQSAYHAAVNHPEQANARWEEARKLFNILHHPLAKSQPAWLESGS